MHSSCYLKKKLLLKGSSYVIVAYLFLYTKLYQTNVQTSGLCHTFVECKNYFAKAIFLFYTRGFCYKGTLVSQQDVRKQ